jgi:hypothetical protein
MQNRSVPTPAWPRALTGDTDRQDAARGIWDALASLDQEYAGTGLPAVPSAWVQRGHQAPVLLADDNPVVIHRGLDEPQGSVDALAALFHPAQGSVPGGWFQDLVIARAGLDRLRAALEAG